MPLDAATQPGVEAEKIEPTPNPRNDFIAQIAERTRQERDEEIKASGGEVVDTKLTGEPEPENKEESAPEPEAKANLESEVAPEAKPEPVEEFVTIKVDGETRQVPKDKIYEAGMRTLQKESAADKRLEEATRLLKDIEQRFVKPQQDAVPPQQWDEPTIAYALEHGTDEQKVEAVRQLRVREKTATPEEIVAIAESRVLDKIDFQDAVNFLRTEYKEIASDPYLLQLASFKENQMRAAGDTRPRKALYKEIGDELRKWKGGPVAAPTLEEKREQKAANVTNLPSASVRKAAPEQPKPKTPSDIIEDMRKRRGQAA